ncbi:MAG: aspartate kinase [Oligoflexales bacterium]
MYSKFPSATVVQKYGGTSVGSPERIVHVAERVVRLNREHKLRCAVVVSAMSGETNRLVALMNQINPDASKRNYDMAVAAGEQISTALVAAAIERCGAKARSLLAYQLGIYTDSFHSKARIASIRTEKIEECWRNGEIPVIAGFQGVTQDMEITTLGRGGSDTSAVAIAIALKADFCEINTDVNGFYTADPRMVSAAKLCPVLDYDLAFEMASLGSKVLHARSVEIAAKYRMPLTVRNTFQPDTHERTVIMSLSEQEKLEAPVVSGVTVDQQIAKLTIENLNPGVHTISEIFELIAKSEINVDIIVHNRTSNKDEMQLGFSLNRGEKDRALSILGQWNEKQRQKASIRAEEGLSKISCVGIGMQSHPGVASRCFRVLAQNNIEIHMISTSEIKISCVIDEADTKKAAQLLHAAFLEA